MNDIGSIDFKVISTLSAEQAHKFRVIPSEISNGHFHCFSGEAEKVQVQQLSFILGKQIQVDYVPEDVFVRHLARYYPRSFSNPAKQKAVLNEESDIVRFVRKVLEEAAAMEASDIHIERYETYARIRFRWEGKLIEKYEVPLSQYNAVISRIKILAELDISERRRPQDGRIHISSQGQKIDVRVSTIPSKYGEKVVMRLLVRAQKFLQLANLGMNPGQLADFSQALNHNNGIILITGPTGSGKTTTLYAALSKLNQPDVNISTIEDPIEYNIEGINQVQVKESIGMDFGKVLRAFLRQDPNIIMIGEIRDRETAEIAIRAALTGHLVFSTIHTNSAWDAVVRLIDMGVEPYLLASSLRLTVAQRLLRVLCLECKKPSEENLYPRIQSEHCITQHFEPVGCPVCHFTGYHKRKAVYEIIPVSRVLTQKIKEVELQIDDYVTEKNIATLQEQVVQLIRSGETSLEEGITFLI